MKKRFCLLLLILCLPVLFCACAEEEEDGLWQGVWLDWYIHESAMDYNTLHVPPRTSFPVYSAPFDSAWRAEDGKAALSASRPFSVFTTMQNGEWSWVEYETYGGARRMGWAKLPLKISEIDDLRVEEHSPVILEQDADLTDDPRGLGQPIAHLKKGDRVIGLGNIDGGNGARWIMVETQIDGQPAWGFLPGDTPLTEIPLYHREGDTLYIHEGVTIVGDRTLDFSLDMEDGPEITHNRETAELLPGDWGIGQLDFSGFFDESLGGVRRIVFPSTLRCLGIEALLRGNFDELRLPGSLKDVSDIALYFMDIGVLTYAADYTGPVLDTSDSTVNEYRVEEGSPLYRAIDGVLFSADKKTLISYPTGRTAAHYDVPRGTEHIGRSAFRSDSLKTISLPIGLRTIGEYAFSGCGRLVSLTVPLTVTDIGENAFAACVSLERLSLPPGLTLNNDYDWAEYPDLTYYNGDNGGTNGTAPDSEDKGWISDYVFLDTPDGRGEIPVYANDSTEKPLGTLRPGALMYANRRLNGRICLDDVILEGVDGPIEAWVDATAVQYEYRLFSVDAAVPRPGAVLLTDGTPADPAWLRLYDIDIAELSCWLQPAVCLTSEQIALLPLEEEDFGISTLIVPLSDVTLYRDAADSYEYAFLIAPDPGEPIPLYDTPDGAPVAHAWSGQQARLGETRDGWTEVVTPMWRRWCESEFVYRVMNR